MGKKPRIGSKVTAMPWLKISFFPFFILPLQVLVSPSLSTFRNVFGFPFACYIYDQSNDPRERFKLEITLTTPLYKTYSIGVRNWFVLDLLTHFCRTGTGIEDQKDSCHYEVKDSYTD